MQEKKNNYQLFTLEHKSWQETKRLIEFFIFCFFFASSSVERDESDGVLIETEVFVRNFGVNAEKIIRGKKLQTCPPRQQKQHSKRLYYIIYK